MGSRKKSIFRTGEHLPLSVPRGCSGSSLVELLTVLALLGIVLGVVYQYLYYSYRSTDLSFAESRLIQEARLFLAGIGREVRRAVVARKDEAGRNVEAVEFIPPDQSTTGQIRIYTDLNGDGRPEMVCYRLRNNSLEKAVVPPEGSGFPYTYGEPATWETVLSQVENSDIFNRVSDLDPDPDQEKVAVRQIIRVNLVLNDPQTPLAQPLRISSSLTVRSQQEEGQ
ncbi:MAG: prepilin-type N-terminal cleavage/methylation domain-containing protein [Peptococcaceae bacterium]|nr:prepilin-type N-terminal cleavage/methylation domain-containing protein [Peptococcaceae bacterium]